LRTPLGDAGQDGVLLELRRPGLLIHRQHAALHHLAGEDFRADDPSRSRRPQAVRKLRMQNLQDRWKPAIQLD
jgi:hypothetical protein